MRGFFYQFIRNIENYKLYHIIIVFTVAFMLIFLNSFYHIKQELITIANQNRLLITKDIEYTIYSWLEERINNLENNVKYLSAKKNFENEDDIQIFLQFFLQNNHYFDTVQALVTDYYFYVNTKKYHDYRDNPIFIGSTEPINPLKTDWYLSTKDTMKTTMSVMEKHGFLLEKTINICTPIISENSFRGVLCGIIKVDFIFNKIDKLKFPQKAYYFISDKQGKILAGMQNDSLKTKIEELLVSSVSLDGALPRKIINTNDVISMTKLKDFDWYIGVGMSKEDILQEGAQKVTSHAIFLFLCFILLLIIINSIHTFLRKRIEKKQKEYEYMLAHRSRISEIGKLISGINHQLKQPLNATALVVSNTLDMSERELLDKQTLEANLKLCQKSIMLMDKTIGIFRNFYRCSEEITHFKLLDCIQSVLHVKHVDLSRHNIIVEVDAKEIASIEVESIENYIQQILLVLIQNAKDALMLEAQSFPKKEIVQKIHLSIFAENAQVILEIADWGCGVSKEINSTLFSEFKSSKKYEGSGIGLYFAKKLAQEKLMGDLVLQNRFAPTIFRLTLAQSLSYKES
jgi:signal transduction histidine kinase